MVEEALTCMCCRPCAVSHDVQMLLVRLKNGTAMLKSRGKKGKYRNGSRRSCVVS